MDRLSTGNGYVRSYIAFMQLPYEKRSAAREAWEKYYQLTANSPIATLIREQNQAFKGGDMPRVKELAKEAMAMRENKDHITIAPPLTADPFEFYHNPQVMRYRSLFLKRQQLEEKRQIIGQQEF